MNYLPAEGFFIQRLGTEEGPYTIPDLQAQARAGYIRGTTMARRADGQGAWFPINELPGVFSDKEWIVALLLSFFVGWLGIDRFYLGQPVLGILKLITFGGCYIWYFVDFVLIAMNKVTDSNGLPLRRS
ncbi:MAG: TM2 domain-containing protein [Chloroflexota bacterium]|nr:TM2 domain-containing protein [Chloroflexota bacterium]